jgi:hypothetical protein
MSETQSSPENPQYSREQVLGAFRKFIEAGYTHPDNLPLDDPEVAEANRNLDAWGDRAEHQAQQNPAPDAMAEYGLSRTTALVDAGFSDPDYLDEVANDLLVESLAEAEEAGLTEAAAHIQAKIDEINARLG